MASQISRGPSVVRGEVKLSWKRPTRAQSSSRVSCYAPPLPPKSGVGEECLMSVALVTLLVDLKAGNGAESGSGACLALTRVGESKFFHFFYLVRDWCQGKTACKQTCSDARVMRFVHAFMPYCQEERACRQTCPLAKINKKGNFPVIGHIKQFFAT